MPQPQAIAVFLFDGQSFFRDWLRPREFHNVVIDNNIIPQARWI